MSEGPRPSDAPGVAIEPLVAALQLISRSLDRPRVVEDILEAVRVTIGIDRAVLIVARGGTLRIAATLVDGEVRLHDAPLGADAALISKVDASGVAYVQTDAAPSILCVPVAHDDTRAVLHLEHRSPGWFVGARRVALDHLVTRAATALAHAELHERAREAERRLQASEGQLRAILENTSAVVFLKDLDGRYILVNRQLELDTGLPRDQVLGKTDFELFPRATAERLRADDRGVIETGEAAAFEGVTEFPDGPRTFLSTKFPLRDADGQVYALCGVATDITARKRAEQAIAAREEDLRITLDSIGDAVIAADGDGRVTRMNPVAEQLTGWSLHEARGLPLAEVVRIEQPAGELDPKVGDDPRHTTLIDRSGGRRQITQTVAPIRDANSGVVGQVTVVRDVTERLRLEDQLRHTQRMNAIGQLAGGVAHDFNNMLTGILAAAELLDAGLPRHDRSPEVSETITTILDTCERAADLTGQLLAFSRRAHRRSEVIDMHELIGATVALLRRSIDRRIALELELNADNPTVLGDRTLLQSALLNLGVNARDAMPGGGTLVFATRDVELSANECAASPFKLEPGPYVELRIRDTGTGIDDQLRLRIFEPFFTTKPIGRGTGLGLAAVHGTVEEQGGSITVDSTVGVGTTFVMHLPSAQSTAKARPRKVTVPVASEARILLVDDEDVVRKTGARLLESLGFEVVTASNGREGIEQFTAHHRELDLVLLDMIMPEMNGHDAFRAMQAIDTQVPIVVCTGYAADESVRSLRDEGLAGFLAKPYRRAELAELVARCRRRPGS